VSLGYILFSLSLNALARGGTIGQGLFSMLSDILTDIGAKLVYFVGILVGLIVFFNTSVDQILDFFGRVSRNMHRLFPSSFLGFFKNKNEPEFKDNAPMKIKGGSKVIPNMSASAPVVNTPMVIKDQPLLSDQLVSNPLSKAGMWEYPPLSLLSEGTPQKADRGDIKEIAATIEKTLRSFSIGAKVVEVNLGPAVTQYALEIAQGTKISKLPVFQMIWRWPRRHRPDKSELKRLFREEI